VSEFGKLHREDVFENLPRLRIISRFAMPLTAEESKRIEEKIARRKQGYRDRLP
jgi:hypothetical protein